MYAMSSRVNVAAAGPSVPLDHWRDNTSSKLGGWYHLVSRILLTARTDMEMMVNMMSNQFNCSCVSKFLFCRL